LHVVFILVIGGLMKKMFSKSAGMKKILLVAVI